MARYAYILPKKGAPTPPQGWRFQWDSIWHEIGPKKPIPEEIAQHALDSFTNREPMQEPVCLVEAEWHEGGLELRPVVPEKPATIKCPTEGCNFETDDSAEFVAHIRECALGEKKPADKKEK